MLAGREIKEIKTALDSAKQPLFFFHDDPDGLASYLLCYKYLREGKGFPIKARPCITKSYKARVEEYRPDQVFVLDVALVDQDFIDAVKIPITWIDHHELQDMQGVKYYNPQKRGVNIPTPVLIWQVLGKEIPEYRWIAVTGSIGDWYWPDLAKQIQEEKPELLPKKCKTVQQAIYETRLGLLVKVFAFNLKGSLSEVRKSLKALEKIKEPEEILEQKNKEGEMLWEKYEKINIQYEKLKELALKKATDDKIFKYIYREDKLSVTKDLANELLYILKDKIIILGRERQGEMRCSLRAPAKYDLRKAFEKAMQGIRGYGGGHEQALGCAINKDDFEQFVENLREELKL